MASCTADFSCSAAMHIRQLVPADVLAYRALMIAPLTNPKIQTVRGMRGSEVMKSKPNMTILYKKCGTEAIEAPP
jgi:hypothetical protein